MDPDEEASSSLLTTARKGDTPDVLRLLSDKLTPESPLTQSGRTLLHVAAHHGHMGVLLQVAAVCAERRLPCNFNVVNKSGHSPLHEACAQGRLSVVHFILSQEPAIDLPAKDDTTCLMLASHGGHMTTAKALIASGADVNATNLLGWTALHFAANQGHLEVLRLVARNGGDPEKITSDGKLAESLAEEAGHTKCVDELKRARGMVSKVTESRVASLEGRLALMEESERKFLAERDNLLSSISEEVRSEYNDLISSLQKQISAKDSELGHYRQLKVTPDLLPRVEVGSTNSAPSSPRPQRKFPSKSETKPGVVSSSEAPAQDQQTIAGWSITDLVELSMKNPNCMSAIKREIKSHHLTPKIARRFQVQPQTSSLSPLSSESSPLLRSSYKQQTPDNAVSKSPLDSTEGLPKLQL